MKFQHLIAPALALLGSAYWIHQKSKTISDLSQKTSIVRERVTLLEKATEQTSTTLAASSEKKQDEFTITDGSPNWGEIAEMMVETSGFNGMPTNIKDRHKLQQKLMELTKEEIVDGLKKITALELEPKIVEMIRLDLISQLSAKNPLAALEALTAPITTERYSIENHIFANAAKEDPTAAIAWIDKKIAEGKLQSTSLNRDQDSRLVLESTLLSQLLTSNYDAAKSRLKAFTEDDTIHLLTRHMHNLDGEAAKNLIQLTRESLPSAKASEAITRVLGNQYHENLSDISATITDLPLTETEKTNVIETLVSTYSRKDESKERFEEIYQWSKTAMPGQESAILSHVLSNTHNFSRHPQTSFTEALNVSQSLGDPKILTSFVSKFSSAGNETTVKRQLERFQDPALAQQYRALVEALPKASTETE